MACPYFIPVEVLAGDYFIHRARLPLGEGYRGTCCAPGRDGASPGEEELRRFCNVGYAAAYCDKCRHFPSDRDWDCVRLGVKQGASGTLDVAYVCERDFVPVAHGRLRFDLRSQMWIDRHADARVQSKAEVYLRGWLARSGRFVVPKAIEASAVAP